jgi:hypothetical protein
VILSLAAVLHDPTANIAVKSVLIPVLGATVPQYDQHGGLTIVLCVTVASTMFLVDSRNWSFS